MNMDENYMAEVGLPGFRFHPTEEELLSFYLKETSMGKKLPSDVIGFLNIYHHDPWELPGLAKIGEREWYFFVHRDKGHGHRGRRNRTTENGFWKATGSDRQIRASSEPKKVLGLKKTFVFYRGRAPRGTKTDWVMNEYRLPDNHPFPKEHIVLCKIYRKATSLKILEQRAAMEDQYKTIRLMSLPSPHTRDTPQLSCIPEENSTVESLLFQEGSIGLPKANEEDHAVNVLPSAVEFGCVNAKFNVRELEVPAFSMDLIKDKPWWIPLKGMWMEQCSPFANLLNL